MHQKTMRLKPLHSWITSHTTMKIQEPNSAYKYPDGIVLTLKTTNQADHYFVERNYALQLANGIKEALFSRPKKQKSVENKPQQPQKNKKTVENKPQQPKKTKKIRIRPAKK